MKIIYRGLRPADTDAAVDLLAQTGAVDNRHRLRTALASTGESTTALTAEHDGRVVGAALLAAEATYAGTRTATVAVAEALRGNGIGTALARRLSARMGPDAGIRAELCDDQPRGRHFAERHGLRVSAHSIGWIRPVEPGTGTSTAARDAAHAAGVRIRSTTVDAEPDVVIAVAADALRTLPGSAGYRPVFDTAEAVLSRFAPGSHLLVAEGELGTAGLGILRPVPRTGQWYTDATMVVSRYRRRGVARALKWAQLAAAAQGGAESVTAHNHEHNTAIIALNESVGMQPHTGYWTFTRE
ncbi:hypothetical protein Val02_65040 [Virgisporangium aliadipatigenens]|uniref:N-acetyltransferase domain-containing protein n=1 Tax=Virgisporangium aliadipatigenens TaxID=741659 RepID=A0A8J4DU21_9ACTN|nr:GNAT family N-acetyltransferase [Virgisporangium aliadipatigenens]GIJ49618.1 hypothetical protein Val02_65040 [Virgisporangium aliadipatigenens]